MKLLCLAVAVPGTMCYVLNKLRTSDSNTPALTLGALHNVAKRVTKLQRPLHAASAIDSYQF